MFIITVQEHNWFLNADFISSNFVCSTVGFGLESAGFAPYNIMVSSFQIGWLFNFFFLIALDRIYSTMLKRSGESGHLSLAPDLKRNIFSFSPLSIMLALNFLKNNHILYVEIIFLFLDCWVFLSWRVAEFYQIFFLHQLQWSCDFMVHSVNVLPYVYGFSYAEPSLYHIYT